MSVHMYVSPCQDVQFEAQITKQQTRLPNRVWPCSQLHRFTFNPNNHKKSEKSTRWAILVILMPIRGKLWRLAEITKQQTRLPNNVWPCSKFPCFTFNCNNPKKSENVPVGAILMLIRSKLWRLAELTKQQTHLPNHVLPCSKLPCFLLILTVLKKWKRAPNGHFDII